MLKNDDVFVNLFYYFVFVIWGVFFYLKRNVYGLFVKLFKRIFLGFLLVYDEEVWIKLIKVYMRGS